MLETVVNTRVMEYIPQLAETPVRLHLLVVDADQAMRSACAEIAASLGYAVESTGDLGQARRPTSCWSTCPQAPIRGSSWSPRPNCSTRRRR
jgi:hypothetical protein